MQALCNSHLIVHKLTTKELFRSAYMWRFGRDITDQSLTDDTQLFDERGKIPPYIVDYFVHIYGAH